MVAAVVAMEVTGKDDYGEFKKKVQKCVDLPALHSTDSSLPHGPRLLHRRQERLRRGHFDHLGVLSSFHALHHRQPALQQRLPKLPLQSHPPDHALHFADHQLLPGNEEQHSHLGQGQDLRSRHRRAHPHGHLHRSLIYGPCIRNLPADQKLEGTEKN
jgi:hypothetical protein